MKQWEYKYLDGVAANIEEKMNALGAEGWEIAFGSVDTVVNSGRDVAMMRAVMKREIGGGATPISFLPGVRVSFGSQAGWRTRRCGRVSPLCKTAKESFKELVHCRVCACGSERGRRSRKRPPAASARVDPTS